MLGYLPSREGWLQFRRSGVAAEDSSEWLTEYCTVVSVQSKVKIFMERIQVPFLTPANSFSERTVEISMRDCSSALSAPTGPTNPSNSHQPRSRRTIRRQTPTY
jgi:hypothetical protein